MNQIADERSKETEKILKGTSKKFEVFSPEVRKTYAKDIYRKMSVIPRGLMIPTKKDITKHLSHKESKNLLARSNVSFTSLPTLQSSISNEINFTLRNSIKRRTIFSNIAIVNGIRIKIQPTPVNNSFVISTKPNGDEYDLYLTQYFINEESAIVEVRGKVIFGGATPDLDLRGSRIPSKFSSYVTYKLNNRPFRIPNKIQRDEIELIYRTTSNLIDDVTESFDDLRLIYPYYNVLKIKPDEVLKPERPTLYGVTDLGISDFKRVEQEAVCYVKGEVSHIENIMASEYKEKTSRSFVSTEITEEVERISESELISDTSTTDRFEMQSEISEVLSSERSKDFSLGTGVSGGYGGVTFNVDTSFDLSSSNSREESNRISLTRAKEVTEQVKDRILSKVAKTRSYKMRKEYEETNKHGYDNSQNDEHVVGIYRWVDKIFENKLVNYGSRLMYEFLIAEPGRNFLNSLEKQSDQTPQDVYTNSANTQVCEVPKHPLKILGEEMKYEELEEEEIYQIAAFYGVKLDNLPDSEIFISRSFSMVVRESGDEWKTDQSQAFNEIAIPDGYYCRFVKCRGKADVHGSNEGDRWATIIVGNHVINFDHFDEDDNHFDYIADDNAIYKKISRIEGNLGVAYVTNDIGSLSFTVTAKCIRKDSVLDNWRNESYAVILKAYEEKLEKIYEQKRGEDVESVELEEPEQRDYNYNPGINRKIERTELKRLCIEMLIKPFTDITISHDHYVDNDAGLPGLNLTEEYDTRVRRVNFLEQAFEWDIMAYKFFPYFYANQKDWYTLMHVDGTADEVFKSFLSSGMAKVKLPVRMGYENAVQYFLNTGEIWQGSGFVLDSDEDLDISINEEIDTGSEEVVIEESWRTRIPTSLSIVQKDGKALDDDGLPCHDDASALAKGHSVLVGAPTEI